MLISAYRIFETRIETVPIRGSKSAAVRACVRTSISDVFTVADIREAVPHIGHGQLGRVLRELKDAGVIERESLGRNASWRRLTTDF